MGQCLIAVGFVISTFVIIGIVDYCFFYAETYSNNNNTFYGFENTHD